MLQKTITEKSTLALKEGNKTEREIYSFFLSLLTMSAKNKNVEYLSDADAISVLQKHRKSLVEALNLIAGKSPEKQNRLDKEIYLLESLIPKSTSSREEIVSSVVKIITELKATSMKDMKSVMSKTVELFPVEDKSLLSEIIRTILNQ